MNIGSESGPPPTLQLSLHGYPCLIDREEEERKKKRSLMKMMTMIGSERER